MANELGPPAGATPIGELQAPAGATPLAMPPQQSYDAQGLRNLWIKAGGKPEDSDMMAQVALNESAGNPLAHNQYVENGVTHQVRGLWQTSDINGPISVDPLENARMAVRLHGQSGLQPWEASRHEGAFGGWGKFWEGLNRPINQPASAAELPPPPGAQPLGPPPGATPIAGQPPEHPRDALQHTPITHMPLPSSANTPHQQPAQKGDPRTARYSLLEQVSGHFDLAVSATNAMWLDAAEGGGNKHLQEVVNLGLHNPAAVAAIYGYNTKTMLDAYIAHAPAPVRYYAELLKSNPDMAGAATFVEEFFNPQSWVEGGIVGRLGGAVLRATKLDAPATALMTRLNTMLSPYAKLVAEHGTGPRNVLATTGSKMALGKETAHKDMMGVFAGKTQDQQLEVVRRQEGLTPRPQADLKMDAEITRAAAVKAELTRKETAAKLAHGVLKQSQVRWVANSAPTDLYHEGTLVGHFDGDPGTYHGRANSYQAPLADMHALLDSIGLRKSGGAASSLRQRVHDNIDQAMAAVDKDGNKIFNFADHDPAEQFRSFMAVGRNRVAFEQGIQQMVTKHPEAAIVPNTPAEASVLARSGKYVKLSDVMGIDTSGNKASPLIKNVWVSGALGDFLTNKNTLASVVGVNNLHKTTQAGKWWDAYNSAMRNMIITNPAYHPFWNIAPNAAAATGAKGPAALGEYMTNWTRALLGTGATTMDALGHTLKPMQGLTTPVARTFDAFREALESPFIKQSAVYQKAVLEAVQAGKTAAEAAGEGRAAAVEQARQAGAGAEFQSRTTLGGNIGKVYTQPAHLRDAQGHFTPQLAREYWDKAASMLNDWNKEATFGPRGEQGFSTTLFHRFFGKGGIFEGDANAAAYAVREALGNYRNVDPESWVSKAIFFWPWLKTNVPFWFKAAIKQPQFVTAPLEGAQRQRELSGDPGAYDPSYAHHGVSLYRGIDKVTGAQRHLALPLPFKDADKLSQVAADAASGNVSQAVTGGLGEVASRMKPAVSTSYNLERTATDPHARDAGTFAGYEVMYNRNAPGGTPLIQGTESALLQMMPLPIPFVARDIISKGYDSAKIADYIQQAAGAGYISEKEASDVHKQSGRQDIELERKMAHARKLLAHGAPEEQVKALQQRAWDVFQRQRAQLKARVAGQKKGAAPLGPPPGAVPLGAPPGATPL